MSGDFIPTKTILVELQENGIMRNTNGRLIGRLVNDIAFDSEHIYAHPTPDAGRVSDDAELERIIDASAGEWHDDEFRITGGDLMHMLRAVSRLRCDAGRVAELEAQLAASDRHGVYLEELTDAQVDRIAALESQLAESREREGRMREALEDARLFIRNGVELGYIRMPDADTPDPAHTTRPRIEAALAAEKGEKE